MCPLHGRDFPPVGLYKHGRAIEAVSLSGAIVVRAYDCEFAVGTGLLWIKRFPMSGLSVVAFVS